MRVRRRRLGGSGGGRQGQGPWTHVRVVLDVRGAALLQRVPAGWQWCQGRQGGGQGRGQGREQQQGQGEGEAEGADVWLLLVVRRPAFSGGVPERSVREGATKGKSKGKSLREIDEEFENQQEVGSVTEEEKWGVLGVDVVGAEKNNKGRLGRWARGPPKPLDLRNRFEALQEIEEVEDMGTDWHDSINCDPGEHREIDKNFIVGPGDGAEEWIQWVAEDGGGNGPALGEIIVDSGAAESVCPWEWARQFPMREIPWNRKRGFRNASGGKMEHYGEK